MNRTGLLILGIGLAGLVGCGGVTPDKFEDPVDVTATVTGPDDKPLGKNLIVALQPTGEGMPARLEHSAGGKFTGKVIPGKYVYYVKLARSDNPPKGIPEKYHTPSSENTVEIAVNKPIEIRLTK